MQKRIWKRTLCLLLALALILTAAPRFGGSAAAREGLNDLIGPDDEVLDERVYYGTRVSFFMMLYHQAGEPEADLSVLAPYTDLDDCSEAELAAIAWAIENGLATGISASTFGPEKSLDKCIAVYFLWYYAGHPDPTTTVNPFSDIRSNTYYYKAVLWATENTDWLECYEPYSELFYPRATVTYFVLYQCLENDTVVWKVKVGTDDDHLPTSDTCGDNLTWSFNQETGALTIEGSGPMWNYETAPNYRNRPWAKFREEITSLSLPDGLSSIGSFAFSGCTGITSVTLPASLTSIGSRAFLGCSSLTSFAVAQGNTNFSVDGEGVLFNADASELICYPGGKVGSYDIPSSVSVVGHSAFYECAGLTAVTFPEGLISIEEDAFSTCNGLRAVSLPDSLTTIGAGAFCDSNSLVSVSLSEHLVYIGEYAFDGDLALAEINFPEGLCVIDECAFGNCAFETVTLPASLTTIGTGAFAGCMNMRSVFNYSRDCAISSYTTTLGLAASTILFGYTGSTTESYANTFGYRFVDIESNYSSGVCGENGGDNLLWYFDDETDTLHITGNGKMESYSSKESVPWSIFQKWIKAVSLPDSITSLGDYAFSGIEQLSSVAIPEGVTSIGNYAFAGSEMLRSVTIPEGVTCIGDYAFENCSSLTEIWLPDSAASLGAGVFSECTGLSDVRLPSSLTAISENLFYDCRSLTDLELPSSLVSIGEKAFVGSALEGIELPEGLRTISERAFQNCSDLSEVTIPESVIQIGGWAFYANRSEFQATILNPGCEIGFNAFGGAYGLNTTIRGYADSTAQTYAETNGCSFIPIGSVTVFTGICGAQGDNLIWTMDFEAGTLTITGSGDMAVFSSSAPWYPYRTSITSITLPDGLTSISRYAFKNCSHFTTIHIPDSVSSIGIRAFQGCAGLVSVTIPGNVDSICDETFSGCTGLRSVTISEGVTTIGSNAFSDCSGMTSVSFPDSLTTIAEGAFCLCTSLTEISLPAGLQQLGLHEFSVFWDYYGYREFGSFEGCSSLASVSFQGGPAEIGTYSFSGCTSLRSVQFSEELTTICQYAFLGCTGLQSVRLPNSLELIDRNAFKGCSALTALIVSNPECLVSTNAIALDYHDTAEDLFELTGPSAYSMGLPEKTIVYGPHDEEKENAAPIKTPVTVYDYYDNEEHPKTLNLEYRYAENYAKTFGYTFYRTGVFSDVAEGKWYEIPVAWAYGKGITTGTGVGQFSPNATCTREQIVTFIWRAYDSPEPGGTELPFTDVQPKYYANAVRWAYYHDPRITSGVDETTFGVGQSCTRAQVVTFLWNAAGKPEPTAADNPFLDVKETDYFYKAVLWAVENGITSGVSPTSFGPKQTCTRAQVVTFLYKAVG